MAYNINGRPSTRAAHTAAYEYGQRVENRLLTKDRIDPYRSPYTYQGTSLRVLTCDKCKRPIYHELYVENTDKGGYVWERQVDVQIQVRYMRGQQGYVDNPMHDNGRRTLRRSKSQEQQGYMNNSMLDNGRRAICRSCVRGLYRADGAKSAYRSRYYN